MGKGSQRLMMIWEVNSILKDIPKANMDLSTFRKYCFYPLHLYHIQCNLIKCHNVIIKNQIKSIKFYIISSCFLQS